MKVIHIAERDTQVANTPKRPSEFVNTWSVDGFVSEGCQPAELGWGTHEKALPPQGRRHDFGPQSAIYLLQPGAGTRVRTWTPKAGPFHGFLITHGESISIPDYLTHREGDKVVYRPTVHYSYHPCNDAVLSVHEFAGRNWQLQERKRILNDEIIDGIDELGVLLAGHKKNAYWYGSQLSIDEARKLAPHNTATSLQVCVAVLSGMVWAMENPQAGVIEPDEMDFRRNLEICMPYLGPVVGAYTRLDAAGRARRAVRGRPRQAAIRGSSRTCWCERADVHARFMLRVSFNLDDADLQHLAEVAQQTQALRAQRSPRMRSSRPRAKCWRRSSQAQLAEFVKERYSRLRHDAATWSTDADWQLSAEDRQRVLNALACFSAPATAAAAERAARSRDHDRAGQPRSAPRPGGVPGLLPLRASRTTRSTRARRAPIASRWLQAAARRRCRSACTSGAGATWTRPAAPVRKLLLSVRACESASRLLSTTRCRSAWLQAPSFVPYSLISHATTTYVFAPARQLRP